MEDKTPAHRNAHMLYREREPDKVLGRVDVQVEQVPLWGEKQEYGFIVRYPVTGALGQHRTYLLTGEQLDRHYEQLPQTLRVQAFGAVFQRPTKAQAQLDAEAAEELSGQEEKASA